MWESELYLWAMFQDCDGGVSNTPEGWAMFHHDCNGGVSNTPVGTCPVVEQDPMKNEYDTEKGQGCIR